MIDGSMAAAVGGDLPDQPVGIDVRGDIGEAPRPEALAGREASDVLRPDERPDGDRTGQPDDQPATRWRVIADDDVSPDRDDGVDGRHVRAHITWDPETPTERNDADRRIRQRLADLRNQSRPPDPRAA